MKIVLSTVGRFHMFALARELEKRGCLEAIYSGFPWRVLARESVSRDKVKTFPWVRPVLMGLRYLPFPVSRGISEFLEYASLISQDRYVARDMPDCDIFVGHESVGLLSGAAAKAKGAFDVFDTGTTHVGWREELLDEEYERVGIGRNRRRNRAFHRQISTYPLADLIVVASNFARRSFVEKGFDEAKIAVIPYGVNLAAFSPVDSPSDDFFDILFVGALSVRKGAHDLFAAVKRLDHPKKRLTLVGSISTEIRDALKKELGDPAVRALGHVHHRELKHVMSRSHALVLPSIEDGFGLVMAEALACGCPVIATTHTGAEDLFTDGVEGYIVPIRDPDAIAERLYRLAADPALRLAMSQAALRRVRAMDGWTEYGERMVALYRTLLDPPAARSAGSPSALIRDFAEGSPIGNG